MSDTTPAPAAPRKSKAPITKVSAAGIGGAVATIVVGIIEAGGGNVDGSLAAAITTVCAFAAGYVTPPRGG